MTQPSHTGQEDRSLGELFGDLSREISSLVRQEMTLAKTEMSQKLARAGKDVALIAMGALLAHAALLAFVAGLAIILDKIVPLWAAPLLAGIIVAAIGAALIMKGINSLKQEDLVPRQTIESLKEDVHGANTARTRAR